MFDLDQFLADCREARGETEPRQAVRDVLRRALDRPTEVADVLRPTEGGLDVLHHSPELTVIHVVWAPGMRIFPHDHRMWAAIAIYAGQEDNEFFRRTAPGEPMLTRSGGASATEGEVLLLGDDAIHAVSNPTDRLTGAIHVYGGDFVNQPRSQWDAGPAEERPYDMDASRQQFAEANAAWRAAGG
jgi:predicted metal-dependent enzyme (double-stranded beta helix superfamily)